MKWLMEYGDWIEVAFSLVSLLTMFVVIWLNYEANKLAEKGVEEGKLIWELENRPYVYFQIDMDLGANTISFCLYNRGKGIAKNIRLELKENLTCIPGREEIPVQKIAMLQEGLAFLAPEGKFLELVGDTPTFFRINKDIPELHGTIFYEDAAGKKYQTPVRVNLKALGKRREVVPAGIDQVVQVLEDIERTLRMRQMRRR
ncbi:MAG: hypothetical protein D6805_04960 [Planctomycetota bacterium]|nr:MAG: hypothetical protein D6805_04960 [Planctomycetota bacterium]